MIIPNSFIHHLENHHGVLLNISDSGVLIIGDAGIGKSSLALDFLHNGHSLIADDCIDFKVDENHSVIGHCPPILEGLLHTRELGLISLIDVFGSSAWQANIQLNYVIRLQKKIQDKTTLSGQTETYRVCNQLFPMVTLDINNPATIYKRINTWLTIQTIQNTALTTIKQRQQIQLEK